MQFNSSRDCGTILAFTLDPPITDYTVVDYNTPTGHRSRAICAVGYEHHTKRLTFYNGISAISSDDHLRNILCLEPSIVVMTDESTEQRNRISLPLKKSGIKVIHRRTSDGASHIEAHLNNILHDKTIPVNFNIERAKSDLQT